MTQYANQLFKALVIKAVLMFHGTKFNDFKNEGFYTPLAKDVTLTDLFNHMYNSFYAEYRENGLRGVNSFRKAVLNEINSLSIMNFQSKKIKGTNDIVKTFSETSLNQSFKYLKVYKGILTNIKYTIEVLLIVKALLSVLTNMAFIPIFALSVYLFMRKFATLIGVSGFYGKAALNYLGKEYLADAIGDYGSKALSYLHSFIIKIVNFVFQTNYVLKTEPTPTSAVVVTTPPIEPVVEQAPVVLNSVQTAQEILQQLPTESFTWIHIFSILGITVLTVAGVWHWSVLKTGVAAEATTAYTYSASTVNAGFGYVAKGIIFRFSSLFALITYPFKSKPKSKKQVDTDTESSSEDDDRYFEGEPVKGRKANEIIQVMYRDKLSSDEARVDFYKVGITPKHPNGPLNEAVEFKFANGPFPLIPGVVKTPTNQIDDGQEIEINDSSYLFNLSSAALRSAANFTQQAYGMWGGPATPASERPIRPLDTTDIDIDHDSVGSPHSSDTGSPGASSTSGDNGRTDAGSSSQGTPRGRPRLRLRGISLPDDNTLAPGDIDNYDSDSSTSTVRPTRKGKGRAISR
jgi:hypothetical protein